MPWEWAASIPPGIPHYGDYIFNATLRILPSALYHSADGITSKIPSLNPTGKKKQNLHMAFCTIIHDISLDNISIRSLTFIFMVEQRYNL